LYEMTNDEESTKITTTAVPGTPAARATNWLDTNAHTSITLFLLY
jgi:hypothetical protein